MCPAAERGKRRDSRPDQADHDGCRARLGVNYKQIPVNSPAGHLLNGVTEPVLQRAFEYWHNVDKNLGDKIEQQVRAKQDAKDPKAAEQANPARSSMQAKA